MMEKPPFPNLSQSSLNHLKFPVLWHGRLIVRKDMEKQIDEPLIRSVFESMGLQPDDIRESSVSTAGTYVSWQLCCMIPDVALFRAVTSALKTLPGVKMLL